jgi:hypothetical protein
MVNSQAVNSLRAVLFGEAYFKKGQDHFVGLVGVGGPFDDLISCSESDAFPSGLESIYSAKSLLLESLLLLESFTVCFTTAL